MEQQSSAVAHIVDYPDEPAALFKQLIEAAQKTDGVLYMNLATIDEEFGVLNRTVVYRGLSEEDDCIIYVTQRFTRNYQNLKANPKCGITLFFPQLQLATETQPMTWQVRLIGAIAEELPESQLDAWWEKELLPGKIRDIIFPCGKPVEYNELKAKHDEFLKEHLASGQPLQRPKT